MSENANTLGLGLVRQPKAVLFGPGQPRQLANIVKGVSEEVLVVTDERMAASPAFAEIISRLETAGIRISLRERALSDLPRGSIEEVISQFGPRLAQKAPIGAIVGIGGGSCLDLAKIVSVVM